MMPGSKVVTEERGSPSFFFAVNKVHDKHVQPQEVGGGAGNTRRLKAEEDVAANGQKEQQTARHITPHAAIATVTAVTHRFKFLISFSAHSFTIFRGLDLQYPVRKRYSPVT